MESEIQQESPETRRVSLKSSQSIQGLIDFKQEHLPSEQHGHQESIQGFVDSKDDRHSPEQIVEETMEVPRSLSGIKHQTDLESIFAMIEGHIIMFVKSEMKRFLRAVKLNECLEGGDEDKEAFLKITMNFLRRFQQDELADSLQSKTRAAACQHRLKSNLKQKFQCLFEGIVKPANRNLLNEIYTELLITEGGSAEVNEEHEVRHIETADWNRYRPETTIRCEEIFEASPERDEPSRAVVTKGVAGIGKTVLTQKFTLDWAEDKANQDTHFLFPFTFRQLNVLKETKCSLVELVHRFFPETKDAGIFRSEEFQVIFIFDGLDECRLPLDFLNNEPLTDVTESSSVDVLLTNLIRGNLLPSARLWITTRPAAANQIPAECVGMVTEVRGFTDPQKDEYFRKRFRDEQQADRIIAHIKTSRSLHIMCHIPVFCWITATVLEDMLRTRAGGELPKTLTKMYVHFLVVQTKQRNLKYEGGAETDPHWSPESRKMIESLGKLAFEQLQKGNLIFYESDLTECGIDVKAASWYSGVFTQVFREESGLHDGKVFCFVHLSVQEFLAALHVHLAFINSGVNLLAGPGDYSGFSLFRDLQMAKKFYQIAVDKALQSPNGHLDLFLRFLLGLSLKSNQTLLPGLLTKTKDLSGKIQEAIQYIKEKIKKNPPLEKSINLFHCLSELDDSSLVRDIQNYLSSGSLFIDKLSPAEWSTLAFYLLSSEEDLDVFDLQRYSASEEALLKMLPVVRASHKALLSGCNLSGRSCAALASLLSSPSCSLRQLDLSNNDLRDSGVKLLLPGLESPHCKLEALRLSGCLISEEGCASLVSALSSNPSHLSELDLSYNHLGASGERRLAAAREDPQWRLDTLRVDHGGVSMLKPGLRKYACELTLDPSTAHRNLLLSDNNRKVISVREEQPYPDNPDRFSHWRQLLCGTGLTCRSYWEVERKGEVHIAVAYKGIRRKGDGDHCLLGSNDRSWSLRCSDDGHSVVHNNKQVAVRHPFVVHNNKWVAVRHPSGSDCVGVYLDWAAGTLSFYRASCDTLIHLHTFSTTFTEPLHAAFGFRSELKSGCFGPSVSLCQL